VWLSNLRAANVDLHEGMQEWRYRHVKMVERTIGARPGRRIHWRAVLAHALAKPAFPDLWEIRASL
jgi:tryptophan 2,3-dioxygenase